MRKKSAISLTSYDDLFKEETSMIQDEDEKIRKIAIDSLQEFPNHPYSVPDNEELDLLAESIKENGVLHPIIVYPATLGSNWQWRLRSGELEKVDKNYYRWVCGMFSRH